MATAPLSQVLGTTRAYGFTIRNDAQQPVLNTFNVDDLLSAKVWSGDDQAILFQPVIEWINPDAATVRITIASAQIFAVLPGIYRIQAFVTPVSDSQKRCFLDGSIQFAPTAGVATPRPVYATYDDMEVYCPQIMKLQDLIVDQANFAQQRARARTWFDRSVTDHYNPQPGRARRLLTMAGSGGGPHDRFAPPPVGAIVPSRAELQEYLDLDRLILTDDIREANAHRAAALVYLAQPGAYAEHGAMHQSMADSARYHATVDVDTDGLGSATIRIGRDVTFLY